MSGTAKDLGQEASFLMSASVVDNNSLPRPGSTHSAGPRAAAALPSGQRGTPEENDPSTQPEPVPRADQATESVSRESTPGPASSPPSQQQGDPANPGDTAPDNLATAPNPLADADGKRALGRDSLPPPGPEGKRPRMPSNNGLEASNARGADASPPAEAKATDLPPTAQADGQVYDVVLRIEFAKSREVKTLATLVVAALLLGFAITIFMKVRAHIAGTSWYMLDSDVPRFQDNYITGLLCIGVSGSLWVMYVVRGLWLRLRLLRWDRRRHRTYLCRLGELTAATISFCAWTYSSSERRLEEHCFNFSLALLWTYAVRVSCANTLMCIWAISARGLTLRQKARFTLTERVRSWAQNHLRSRLAGSQGGQARGQANAVGKAAPATAARATAAAAVAVSARFGANGAADGAPAAAAGAPGAVQAGPGATGKGIGNAEPGLAAAGAPPEGASGPHLSSEEPPASSRSGLPASPGPKGTAVPGPEANGCKGEGGGGSSAAAISQPPQPQPSCQKGDIEHGKEANGAPGVGGQLTAATGTTTAAGVPPATAAAGPEPFSSGSGSGPGSGLAPEPGPGLPSMSAPRPTGLSLPSMSAGTNDFGTADVGAAAVRQRPGLSLTIPVLDTAPSLGPHSLNAGPPTTTAAAAVAAAAAAAFTRSHGEQAPSSTLGEAELAAATAITTVAADACLDEQLYVDAPWYEYLAPFCFLWVPFQCLVGINLALLARQLPSNVQHSTCLTWFLSCQNFTRTSVVFVGIMLAAYAGYAFVYFVYCVRAFSYLRSRSYVLYRQLNIYLSVEVRIRGLTLLFLVANEFVQTLLVPAINVPGSGRMKCRYSLDIVLGVWSTQVVTLALVCSLAWLFIPRSVKGDLPIMQATLQRFSWTERGLQHQLGMRLASVPHHFNRFSELLREPMFCFETAVKLTYWCEHAYYYEEPGCNMRLPLGTLMRLYNFEHIQVMRNEDSDAKVIIAWNFEKCMLCFRGTASLKAACVDIKAMLVPYYQHAAWSDNHPVATFAAVHHGFQWSWTHGGFNEEVLGWVKAYRSRHPHGKIIVTGHSLGGAHAALCTIDIVRVLGDSLPYNYISCYTFGSPRVGNHSFAALYDKVVYETWHVINGNDMVPLTPKIVIFFVYKQPGLKVIVKQRGDLVVRPTFTENSVVRMPCSRSVAHHLLSSYIKSLMAVLRSQTRGKHIEGGVRGLLHLTSYGLPEVDAVLAELVAEVQAVAMAAVRAVGSMSNGKAGAGAAAAAAAAGGRQAGAGGGGAGDGGGGGGGNEAVSAQQVAAAARAAAGRRGGTVLHSMGKHGSIRLLMNEPKTPASAQPPAVDAAGAALTGPAGPPLSPPRQPHSPIFSPHQLEGRVRSALASFVQRLNLGLALLGVETGLREDDEDLGGVGFRQDAFIGEVGLGVSGGGGGPAATGPSVLLAGGQGAGAEDLTAAAFQRAAAGRSAAIQRYREAKHRNRHGQRGRERRAVEERLYEVVEQATAAAAAAATAATDAATAAATAAAATAPWHDEAAAEAEAESGGAAAAAGAEVSAKNQGWAILRRRLLKKALSSNARIGDAKRRSGTEAREKDRKTAGSHRAQPQGPELAVSLSLLSPPEPAPGGEPSTRRRVTVQRRSRQTVLAGRPSEGPPSGT